MLEVKGIQTGIVIDHIKAGTGLIIFNKLFHTTKQPVVLLMNVNSKLLGTKDIIKMEGSHSIDVDMLGLIDENITVNFIEDNHLVKKINTGIPTRIKGGMKCDNPRCISHTDDCAIPEFTLVTEGKRMYSCSYCEERTVFKLED